MIGKDLYDMYNENPKAGLECLSLIYSKLFQENDIYISDTTAIGVGFLEDKLVILKILPFEFSQGMIHYDQKRDESYKLKSKKECFSFCTSKLWTDFFQEDCLHLKSNIEIEVWDVDKIEDKKKISLNVQSLYSLKENAKVLIFDYINTHLKASTDKIVVNGEYGRRFISTELKNLVAIENYYKDTGVMYDSLILKKKLNKMLKFNI